MTSAPSDFFAFSRADLEINLAESLGFKPFRAKQLFQWVYQRGVVDPALMTDLSKAARSTIASQFWFGSALPNRKEVSTDGTRKFLFGLPRSANHFGESSDHFGEPVGKGTPSNAQPSTIDEVESVLIRQPGRFTLCVSSQVGCGMGCKFCRTATMGFIKNLTPSQIVRQVWAAKRDAESRAEDFFNIVFMGMGEPLHNFEGVAKAVEILTDGVGFGFSHRRITVSTVGLVPAIKRFYSEKVKASLAVSLNATTNAVRSEIMPINERFDIDELLHTLRSVPLHHRSRITIEYVMLAGINDTLEDLRRLPKILAGVPCKVNLIPYNENAGLGYKSPSLEWVTTWQKELTGRGLATMVRWSKGQDINAACGQLATAAQRVRRAAVTALPVFVAE